MSTVGTELAQIAEIEIPGMADDFPDTMTILGESATQGSGGGIIKGGTSNFATGVPCIYEPDRIGSRFDDAGQLVSQQPYTVTFPMYWPAGTRLVLSPKTHTLVVAARGEEPEKVFEIVAVRDVVGVLYEATCTKEN